MGRCGLAPDVLLLTRIAAFVAMDTPVMSYQADLMAGEALAMTPEQLQDAIAPIVGSARVMAAGTHIAEVPDIDITAAEPESAG
ncbi:MAG TPA: carboxymuconolactone decarboxylase [Yinghuangia sp.]|uniref:carboxymuconolactone decarboxylase n=1 Tax=Yinghuangia sp. YIM S10712 TaxID=3436930 RepID=UPI002BB144AE|nr:carboxymuconolactone decarboxylase [Yinghuangia sp.]